jgi:threonine dehydrogenase-like Zn-dependent dehydrogenase
MWLLNLVRLSGYNHHNESVEYLPAPVTTAAPTTGLAALVTAWGKPLQLREFPLPAPEPGALLVRVERATICGSDVHLWEGALARSFPIELPVILGHETVGRIASFGEGTGQDSVGTPLRAGDRVVWEHEACGHCYECTVLGMGTMCPNRQMGFLMHATEPPHFHGGFAEYSYVRPKAGRLRVPDDVESEWAAAASCALRTIIEAMRRVGAVDYRHSVVIQGSGPLGLFATAMVSLLSPRRLVTIGGPESRLAVASEWGADLTIDVDVHASAEERRALVLDATEGRGADVVFELSGAPNAVAEGLRLAAAGGRYLVAGTLGGGPQAIAADLIARRNLRIIGSLGAEIDAYYLALALLRRQRNRFDWSRLIGGRYRLADATTALERMQDFTETKAVIVP